MKIPFFDLHRQHESIADEIELVLRDVIASKQFSHGSFTMEFERQFAQFCGSQYAAAVNSGTAALQLALLAAGIKPGDEVIVPSNTFIATASAVCHVGAIPVFVDCDKYWNIAVDLIASALTTKTRALIGVHLYGQPCDIDALSSICSDNNLVFIEDAAQAHGALYKGEPVGSFGQLATFSFYPGKNLGAFGEGGAVTTQSECFFRKIGSLRNHGSVERYYHDELGFNMRMDGLQGAILGVKLRHIEAWNRSRMAIALRYLEEINHRDINLPLTRDSVSPVYHQFVITVPERKHFMDYMSEHSIATGIHYPIPCHLQKAFEYLGYRRGRFPRAEFLAGHCVSLPIYPELNQDEVSHIISTVNEYQPPKNKAGMEQD